MIHVGSSDLERWDTRVKFWGISIITLVWFDLNWHDKTGEGEYVSRGSPCPIPRGWASVSPKFLGLLPTPKQFNLQQPNLMGNTWGRSVFIGDPRSRPKGAGPSVPRIF